MKQKQPKPFRNRLFFALLLALGATLSSQAQNGTADGTYHFASLGAANSGGTGFKRVNDKFVVDNAMINDPTVPGAIYNPDLTEGGTVTTIFKAENGSVCKTFSLRNMQIRDYGTILPLKTFTIRIYNYSGSLIGQHTLASSYQLTETPVNISGLPLSPAWPVNGYDNVNTVSVTYSFDGARPDDLLFVNWTVANISGTVLPVTLRQFTAALEGDKVQLRWSTAQEANSDYTVVERSADGRSFAEAGRVQAAGNSSTVQFYQFADPIATFSSSVIYYRLKMVDNDGQIAYSRVIKISRQHAFTIDVLANPFGEELVFTITAEKATSAHIILTDEQGRTVEQEAVKLQKGSNLVKLSKTAGLPKGVYLATVQTSQVVKTVKVVKK